MHIIDKIRYFTQWFVILGIIFIAVIINFAVGFNTMRNSENWISHTHEVQQAIADTKMKFHEAENVGRLLLVDKSVRDKVVQSRTNVIASIANLRHLTSDNPEQQEYVNQLQIAVAARFTVQEQQASSLIVQNGKAISDVSLTLKGIEAQNQVIKLFDSIGITESHLLQSRSNQLRTNQWFVLYVFAVLIILSIPTGIFLFLSTIKSLNQQLETSEFIRDEMMASAGEHILSIEKAKMDRLLHQIENISVI